MAGLANKKIWDRREIGPSGTIGCHKVGKPYHDLRAVILREAFPGFDDKTVEALAAGTFGYTREQIHDAGRIFQTGHILPGSHYSFGKPPLDPQTKSYIERLIYPGELYRQLQEVGFKFRIYAYLGGAGGNPAIRAMNAIVQSLSPLTWLAGRALRVAARK
jgi:hypothetical protein